MIYLLLFLAANFFLEAIVESLNLSRLRPEVPKEFQDVYTDEKYSKSQEYLKATTKFGLIQAAFGTLLLMAAIATGVLDWWDIQVRDYFVQDELRGLAFVAGMMIVGQAVSLPFSVWSTFVIEEKFGFNRTTPKTFALDRLKGWVLGLVIGGPLLFGFFWIWNQLGQNAWVWAWIFITTFQLFMMFIAPVTIMPLFNKFNPLADGELKSSIEKYAKSVGFRMQGIFTMDGSKRSTKANAYFTGFGRFRRIVLFDTLIQKHSLEELMAVLAHEVGHYKLKHIFRQLYLSIVISGVTFYLMSLFATHPFVFEAFQISNPSFYTGLIFFGILYSPISSLISMYSLYLSRKYEFEADKYSKDTYGKPEALAVALKKLSADNLSNLNPHPLKVFLEYTHPPVMRRLERLSYLQN